MKWLCAMVMAWVAGCTGVPSGVTPVKEFELDRYLGKWYEIARLDHSFERGMQRVTAEYSLRDDGGVRVVNRGYRVAKDQWKQSEGRAYFVKEPDEGRLKVSFFGPFYGSYIVIDLDRQGYEWAMVSGPDRSYLWILARSPHLPEDVKSRLLAKAREHGFATDKLIWVEHE